MHVEAVREYIRHQPEHHNRRISKPSSADSVRRTENRWMNDMRGIELGHGLAGFVLFRPCRAGEIFL
jgi:hypothetical protein